MSTSNTNSRASGPELIIAILDTVQPTARLMRNSVPAFISVTVLTVAIVEVSDRYTSNYVSAFRGCPSSAPTPTTHLATLVVVGLLSLTSHLPVPKFTKDGVTWRRLGRGIRFAHTGLFLMSAGEAVAITSLSTGRQAVSNGDCVFRIDHYIEHFAGRTTSMVGMWVIALSYLASNHFQERTRVALLGARLSPLMRLDPHLEVPTTSRIESWTDNQVRTIRILASLQSNTSPSWVGSALRYTVPAAAAITLGIGSYNHALDFISSNREALNDQLLRESTLNLSSLMSWLFVPVVIFLALDLRSQLNQWLRRAEKIIEISRKDPGDAGSGP